MSKPGGRIDEDRALCPYPVMAAALRPFLAGLRRHRRANIGSALISADLGPFLAACSWARREGFECGPALAFPGCAAPRPGRRHCPLHPLSPCLWGCPFDPSLMTHILFNRPDVQACNVPVMLNELNETVS